MDRDPSQWLLSLLTFLRGNGRTIPRAPLPCRDPVTPVVIAQHSDALTRVYVEHFPSAPKPPEISFLDIRDCKLAVDMSEDTGRNSRRKPAFGVADEALLLRFHFPGPFLALVFI
ncbi:hypothetical protein ROHU_015045 [Labeo rohita]|uniref:Uncharacterized protein n=1 Tax=Labeo rohita TaxID=84645 RepID=A0A498NQI1_LABRO|nr:hypothetical protein ROHU_015045 [Labeo rohita]